MKTSEPIRTLSVPEELCKVVQKFKWMGILAASH